MSNDISLNNNNYFLFIFTMILGDTCLLIIGLLVLFLQIIL